MQIFSACEYESLLNNALFICEGSHRDNQAERGTMESPDLMNRSPWAIGVKQKLVSRLSVFFQSLLDDGPAAARARPAVGLLRTGPHRPGVLHRQLPSVHRGRAERSRFHSSTRRGVMVLKWFFTRLWGSTKRHL